jgi:hypothetical protein
MITKHAIKFVPLLFALLIQGCASTTEVTPVASVTRSGRGGIVYALPETVLDIVVPIDRTTETPPQSPFAEYSEKLFGQKPKITADKVTYAIGVPTVTASGQPDQSKVFYAQISGGPFSDSSMTMKFDARGVLTSSTVESENKTLEFVVSTFEAGAKIGGSAVKLISATNAKPCDGIPPAVCDAYTRIQDAIQSRSNILTGPGGDVATRLAEINESIKKDMALFFGSKSKDTWSAQFRIVPRGSTANISLFSYSPGNGIVEFHISPRNQINRDFVHSRSGPSKPVYVNIAGIQPLVENAIATGRLFTQEKRGLHYNIPAVATVRVYDGTTKLLTSNQSFAQFGSIGFLPVSTGSHKLHQEITLDGATGALLAVTNSSNAFDPNNINKLGNAASGFIDTLETPKTKAERERDIAKAKYEKLDLEKKTRDLEASMKTAAATGAPGTP